MDKKSSVETRSPNWAFDFDDVLDGQPESWMPKPLKELLDEQRDLTLQERMQNWGSD